jgi:hypothetical protein
MKQKRSSLLRKREGSVRAKTRYISELINESTNAPAQDVLMIEHIMRSDVFHSTLDWQSEEQSNPHRPRAFGGKGAEGMKKEITRSLSDFELALSYSRFTSCPHDLSP